MLLVFLLATRADGLVGGSACLLVDCAAPAVWDGFTRPLGDRVTLFLLIHSDALGGIQ